MIIGATHDSQSGQLLMFGLGGVFVEIMKDVVFRTLPLDRAEASRMVTEIRGRSLFDGVRGAKPVDREALVSLLLNVATIAEAHPEIAKIDLNPVIVNKDGYAVVDARIILGEPPFRRRIRNNCGPDRLPVIREMLPRSLRPPSNQTEPRTTRAICNSR